MNNNEKVYNFLSKKMNSDNTETMIELIDIFTERGFNINYAPKNKVGFTKPSLLEISIAKHCDDLFKYLIKKGANYNAKLVDIDTEDYVISFMGYGEWETYQIHPKIADMLVKYQKWDLLKVIINDCELSLDGTIYKIFERCLHNYNSIYDKKYFNKFYKDVWEKKEMPEAIKMFKREYNQCIEILQRLSERFNIDLSSYKLRSLEKDGSSLRYYFSAYSVEPSHKKMPTGKSMTIFDSIMEDISSKSQITENNTIKENDELSM